MTDDIFLRATELLRENLLPVLDKMLEEAKGGNVQAAKFLYPYLSELLKDSGEGVDIWKTLRNDDAE
jgi:hypothetical protein